VLLVLVGLLVLVLYLRGRDTKTADCRAWRAALAELSASTKGLGTATSQQFREQAIRRGWVDTGGKLVRRPAGCTP
jgi:hypothetical protein